MEICFEGVGRSSHSGPVVSLLPPALRRWGPGSLRRRGGSLRTPRPPQMRQARINNHRPLSASISDDFSINKGEGRNLKCDENVQLQNQNSEGAENWAASFEKLLEDPLGLQTFAEFLKKEFSAENIYFWTSCERYRRLSKTSERSPEAQKIYRRHLCPGAPEPVNVDSHGRNISQTQLHDADSNLFEQAQKQILNLMKFDSYPRFLKSDIYKQCLVGSYEYPNIEQGLMICNGVSINKLKKSLSNAEDRRRKSLLPWHRKNRSKSKDRGELEYNQHQERKDAANHQGSPVKSGSQVAHSSQSSLTSLDLAMSCSMQDNSSAKGSQDELNSVSNKGMLCRVILNDGATTVVQIRPTETIRELVNRLLDKRGLNYSAYEVFLNDQTKSLNTNELSAILSGSEVKIEQRVVFKLDLPNRKVISVKSKVTKILVDVLRPILHKYGFGLDTVRVSIGAEEFVDINLLVTSVDGCRLNIQLVDDMNKSALATFNKSKQQSLEEINNKVFEQLLQEKSKNTAQSMHNYDKSSVKSEDWGSEHSSGIFGRFLRRDSGVHERKKKLANVLRPKGNSTHSSVEDITGEQISKKPLIAKWKPGAKLQVACSESDELYEGLKRAQRSRLEDQRGTEINFELPDFLKDNQVNKLRKINSNNSNSSLENSRFYDSEITEKIINPPLATTRHLKTENSENSLSSSRDFNTSLENSMIENYTSLNPEKSNDPPPLPPKPKVVPIKPSNWAHHNLFKIPKEIPTKNDARSKHKLYLEQPTSSFV